MTAQDDVVAAKALLRQAALAPDVWPAALAALARACGGWSGQLIGLNEAGQIVTHVLTGVADEELREIEAFGLADPLGNPRLGIGRHAEVLTPVADQDYVDEAMRRRHPIYEEIFDRLDLSFNCQTVLVREPGLLLRTSITRSARQGALQAEDYRAFAALAPHVQAAARTQLALENAQARSSIRMLDALAAPGVLLDQRGRLVALSAAAEAAMSAGRLLRLRGAGVAAVLADDDPILGPAIDHALAASRDPDADPPTPVVVRDADGRPDFILEITPIPGDGYVLGLAPAVLILARPAATAGRSIPLPAGTWDLSVAEADIATRLAAGQSLETIAEARAVSLTTVRSQLQAIYAKTGLHRQAELVAAVLALVGLQA